MPYWPNTVPVWWQYFKGDLNQIVYQKEKKQTNKQKTDNHLRTIWEIQAFLNKNRFSGMAKFFVFVLSNFKKSLCRRRLRRILCGFTEQSKDYCWLLRRHNFFLNLKNLQTIRWTLFLLSDKSVGFSRYGIVTPASTPRFTASLPF